MPDDVKTVSLYEQDFFAWGLAQARALRSARDAIQHAELRNTKLQRALAGAGLGQSRRGDRRAWRAGIGVNWRVDVLTIIEHLLKLQHSAASEPRAGWMETVGHARSEVEDIVRDSPSLRREVAGMIARKSGRLSQIAAKSLVSR